MNKRTEEALKYAKTWSVKAFASATTDNKELLKELTTVINKIQEIQEKY